MAEIDPLVVEVCKKYLPQTACRLDDPRLSIHYEDGVRFVRSKENCYDLIIVDSTDPFGPGEGLFTREFYGSCFKALREDGIMVNQHESPFYAADAAACQRAHKLIVESFHISRVLSGAHSHLSFRPLAVRLCLEKISSAARPEGNAVEHARPQMPLLHHNAAQGRILSARLCGGSAERC